MTTYTEKTLTGLVTGALDVDGDPITVRRINGTVPSSWPFAISLLQGSVEISEDGAIIFNDEGDTSQHPTSGSLSNGSFTFTLWDGQDESAAYTASISLEAAGSAAITAPAKPGAATIANETSSTFDVTIPADPSDGGDPIIRRVVSIMPQAEYDAGNFTNAVYINNFAATETRTITASNYPALANAQTHAVRWKAINGATDNGGHGPYSDPVTATLPAAVNPPVFTTQPGFSGAPFTVGDTVTLSLGAGTGDNSVTATIEYFRLGATSKISELSGLTWNSTGEAPGAIYLRTRLTDDVTGAFTLSNEVSVALSASGGTGSVKDQVIALFGTSGRNSGAALQTLTGSNAPAGVSVSANVVTISGNGVTLADYVIHDKTIFINSDNVTIRQCRITEGPYLNAVSNRRIIDIKANMKNFLIEDNDFDGVKGLGSGVSSAIFQRPLTATAAGTGGIIRRNRFRWFGQDIVKTTGGVLVEENVFYAQSNVATTPSGRWNSGTTYGLNEVVKHTSNEKHYISRVANNRGNALTDSSKWQFFDPHYDIYNPYENTIASTCRRNLFLRDNADAIIPAAERSVAVGPVNAIRMVRNGGNTTAYRALVIEENVILGYNTYFSGVPMQASNTGGIWIKPTIQGNYIDDNVRGEFTHPSTASAVTWGTNYDATTGATIGP